MAVTTRMMKQKKGDTARKVAWKRNLSLEKKKELYRKENMRRARVLFSKKCDSDPRLSSFLVRNVFPKRLEQTFLRFVRRQLDCFANKMVVTIKPLWNDARLNFQSPQAIRMFFAKNAPSDKSRIICDRTKFESRFFYGYGGIHRSTGIDPRELMVHQVDHSLDIIL